MTVRKLAAGEPIALGVEDSAAVVGRRGTGKTTLFRALHGLPGPPRVRPVWDPLQQYDPRFAYVPPGQDTPRVELDAMLRAAYASQEPVRVFIEEAEEPLREGQPFLPATQAWFQKGRNLGHSWVVNTRRPAMLAKFLLEEADHVFIFMLRGRSVASIVEILDLDDDEEAALRGAMKAWRKEEHRFWWYRDGQGLIECPRLKVRPAA